MEPYLLTIEDIDNLAAKGFDIRGLSAGSEAVKAEVDALNLSVPAPTAAQLENAEARAERARLYSEARLQMTPALDIPVPPPFDRAKNAATALGVSAEDAAFMTDPTAPTAGPAPAAAATPSGTSTMQQLMALMAPAPAPRSNDPFENLSKTQRRMLAFSAMSDAGASLAGRQGGSFDSMLSRFGEMEDMNRKRTAAENQQAMMSRLMGGAGTGTGAGGTIEDQIRYYTQMLTIPSMVPFASAKLAQLSGQADTSASDVGIVVSASDTLATVDDLIQSVTENPRATGFWSQLFGWSPSTKAGELRIDAQTLKSNMALDALLALKAKKATLGSVSEKELELLAADITALNFGQSQEAVLKDLELIRARYQRAIRSAYRDTTDVAALTAALGGRPTWLDSDDAAAPAEDLSDDDLRALYGSPAG
tara:strand:+ start:384 stop:1649 length:1266 start_codon:yes stop_codon:yes gene_type:complete